MATHWYRTQQVNNGYQAGYLWQCAIPSGATYRRIRWSWGFAGVTADTADIYATMLNLQIAGLCTTIGDGTEVPPNAAIGSSDVDPPTQRWLWWETRQPVITAVDHAAGVITWRDSGPQEIPDVKTQVLATGIPGGDTLNLWFSWQSAANAPWDASGSQVLWVSTSVLYTT